MLAEVEERRYSGGSVVMRKGELVDAWTGVIDGLVKINVVSLIGQDRHVHRRRARRLVRRRVADSRARAASTTSSRCAIRA